jgi:hypothetical protein
MDLESESVEENEVVTPETLSNGSESKIENNSNENNNNEQVDAAPKTETDKVEEPRNSPSQSRCASSDSSPSAGAVKGFGLKKWRRIKREVNHEDSTNTDTGKILHKRGFTNPQPTKSGKPINSNTETRQKSEGSVSSTNALLKSPIAVIDDFSILGENGLTVGPTFAAGTDSENSEDRSSKSSTAASAPRMRYDVPSAAGFGRDKGKMKNLGGKNPGNSVQIQQKGKTETSKKARGDNRVKIEKENSHSSIESDSRSSNFVFMQGFNSINSNGRQQSENSDEFQESVGFRKNAWQENLGGGSSWEIKEENSENGGSSVDRDPLLDYILNLQSVQEELEKEVNKLKEIGIEDTSLFDDSANSAALPPDSESETILLKKNIEILKNKLDKIRAALETKEAKITELESALTSSKSQTEDTVGPADADLEELFKQKIEAEVAYFTISRATKEPMNKFENREIILGKAEIKKRVRKCILYFLIQLFLLALVFRDVAFPLSPHSAEVVPT